MHSVKLPSGESVPCFGMGTWQIGDDPKTRAEEIATLQLGLDLGAALIDTAEMYGEGRSEQLIGEAIRGRRDQVFLVTKVYPHNASQRDCSAACERSLRRLQTDRIDLYLLHWRGQVPLGGAGVASNQLLYNLARRGVEWDLLPWLRERRIPVMAYSPVEQGKLLRQAKLRSFAKRHAMTPAQVALGWLLAQEDVIVIPKTGNRERLKENLAALEHPLTPTQIADLEKLFPAPARARPLDML